MVPTDSAAPVPASPCVDPSAVGATTDPVAAIRRGDAGAGSARGRHGPLAAPSGSGAAADGGGAAADGGGAAADGGGAAADGGGAAADAGRAALAGGGDDA